MGSSRGKVNAMRFVNKALPLIAAFLFLIGTTFAIAEFLPPEKAFQVKASWIENTNDLELEIFPAKGYYIYQESLPQRQC